MHIMSALAVSPCVSEELYITSAHDSVQSVAHVVCNMSASHSLPEGVVWVMVRELLQDDTSPHSHLCDSNGMKIFSLIVIEQCTHRLMHQK